MGLERILQRLRRVDPDTILAAVAAAIFAVGVPAYLARQPSPEEIYARFAREHIQLCVKPVEPGDTFYSLTQKALRDLPAKRIEGKVYRSPLNFSMDYPERLAAFHHIQPNQLQPGMKLYLPEPREDPIPLGCFSGDIVYKKK